MSGHHLSDDEFAKRVQVRIDMEMEQPEEWCGLSFALTGRFLGFTIVRARGMATAVRRAHQLGINPGGEVLMYTFDRVSKPPDDIFEKLVTNKADLDRIIHQWGD
jgi:hypothetical protein